MIKKIKVGCFTYTVHFQTTDSDHGATNPDTKVIIINNKSNLDVQRETLLHELQHVAFDDCSLFEYPIPDAEKQEEAIIRFNNPRLFQILRDNKWVREFLFGKGQ
jgi:Zn-dependent peptidase ImmA (M78 family)